MRPAVQYMDERLPARFWKKTAPCPMSGCWLWTAATDWGYGVFGFGQKTYRAHRVSWEHLVGPIPDGLHIDHLCRVRCCVNPAHLEPVTQRENLIRGEGFCGKYARATRCTRGHAFDEENTRWTTSPRGYITRECRECARIVQRASRIRVAERRKLQEVG